MYRQRFYPYYIILRLLSSYGHIGIVMIYYYIKQEMTLKFLAIRK